VRTRQEITELLEQLVDDANVADVLDELATVCFAKADHVRTAWQTPQLAAEWERAGHDIERLAERLSHGEPGIGGGPS
jgi:hypothetical protein